jgi:manganese/iron transport system permease protein
MRSLLDSFASATFRRAILEVVIVGITSGIVGVHVLLRRLPFFVVAMSHATFPGVVIASLLGMNLLLGASLFGLLVVVAVVAVGTAQALDDATATGVVLAGSFAIGVVIMSARPGSSRELSSFLVGSVLTVSRGDVGAAIAVTGLVLAVLALLHKELVLSAFDPIAAAALGYPRSRLDAALLVVVTISLVVSIPAVGTLLSVALLTVPALTARLWSDRIGTAMAIAASIGAASGFVGLCASALWRIAAGGAIALTCSACFVVSLAIRVLRDSRRPAGTAPSQVLPPR